MTCVNKNEHTIVNIISITANNCIHLLYSAHVSPLKTEVVTSIAPSSIGNIKGNNNIGKRVSLTPVFEVIDPIIVPITEIPRVVNTATKIIGV